MLGKLSFLSLAFSALASPLIGSWVRTTPTFENVTDTPTFESVTDTPTLENVTDTPTFESVTDTPTLENIMDTPTCESVTDTPTLENVTDTPTFESVTDTPTLENFTHTPTFENVTDTLTFENIKRIPIFEYNTGIPPLENITGNPHPEKSENFPDNSTIRKSENIMDNSMKQGGCTFDDNLLVGGSSNETSNDYSAFQLSSAFYWNDNQIPFFFRSDMQENEKIQIKGAMSVMQDNTCIRFVEYPENGISDHHLEIFNKYQTQDCSQRIENSAVVINTNSAEKLTMSFDKSFECRDWTNLILHELGHVVGLAHTQKRPDRDQFIQVNLNCIEPGQEDQFKPHREDEVDTFGVPYKCNSMMHYGANTFSNGCDTMTPQPGQCENGIGGNGPIPEDWELINKAYNC